MALTKLWGRHMTIEPVMIQARFDAQRKRKSRKSSAGERTSEDMDILVAVQKKNCREKGSIRMIKAATVWSEEAQ